MMRSDENRVILSSLPLQILLYFNGWFNIFFVVLNLALYTYKGINYYYPKTALGMEIAVLLLFVLLDCMRLFLTSKGNKTEQINPLLFALGLGIPNVVVYSYFIALQTYVLRMDVIVSAIGLAFLCLEVLFTASAILGFYSSFRG